MNKPDIAQSSQEPAAAAGAELSPAESKALAIKALIRGLEQTERVWQIAISTKAELNPTRDDHDMVGAMIDLQCDTAAKASAEIMQALQTLGVDKPFGAAK